MLEADMHMVCTVFCLLRAAHHNNLMKKTEVAANVIQSEKKIDIRLAMEEAGTIV